MIVKAQKPDDTSLGTYSRAGKWSPDSNKILIWMMPQSGSLSADGVSAALYDSAGKKISDLDVGGLSYDENVSFADSTNFAMISGGSRMMFESKNLSLFNLKNSYLSKTLGTPGLLPTTPSYSCADKKFVFSASPAVKADDEYKNQITSIEKRQIYMCKDSRISALTNDKAYRSEAPMFLKDNRIIFVRINTNNELSLWTMDSNGSNQKPLVQIKYNDPHDDKFWGFYGRYNWSDIFTVFDGN